MPTSTEDPAARADGKDNVADETGSDPKDASGAAALLGIGSTSIRLSILSPGLGHMK
jgi:hypothetical protein